MKVLKYRLALQDGVQTVVMTEHAKIVAVAMQGDWVCLWALVQPSTEVVERRFQIFPTGGEATGVYVGTAFHGVYVWHVFEV